MAESIFDDQSQPPSPAQLDSALGKTAELLKAMEASVPGLPGETHREWKFYNRKAGWTLALVHKGRRIFHLVPRSGFFTVVFTLGRQAVQAAEASGLPEEVLTALAGAREYAEGRSIRLDVASAEDAAVAMRLMALKLSVGG